jgi:hypothetical protein
MLAQAGEERAEEGERKESRVGKLKQSATVRRLNALGAANEAKRQTGQ